MAACVLALAAPPLSAGVALLLGVRGWRVVLAAVAAPAAASLVLSVVLLASLLVAARPARPQRTAGDADPPPSAERRAATADVLAAEQALDAASCRFRDADDEPAVIVAALALFEAQLRLANVLLREDGDLPRELKDELLVRYRASRLHRVRGRGPA